MFKRKEYQINLEFKNRTKFLKTLTILFKNGYQGYIKIHQYSKGLEIKGTCLNRNRVNEILKILDRKLIKHLEIDIKIIESERRIIIKDEEEKTHIPI